MIEPSSDSKAPATTGRRTWRLIRTLTLPWVVCGGLLWALVGLTQDFPGRPGVGLTAELRIGQLASHPAWLLVGRKQLASNLAAGPSSTAWGSDQRGFLVFRAVGHVTRKGRVPQGRQELLEGAGISLWYLLPIPLLWSGVNLWRWVRRGSTR